MTREEALRIFTAVVQGCASAEPLDNWRTLDRHSLRARQDAWQAHVAVLFVAALDEFATGDSAAAASDTVAAFEE